MPLEPRFDATAARRGQEAQAARMMIKAFALGGDTMRAAFAGYDPDRLFDAAMQSSVLARVSKAAVAAVDFDPLDLGPLRYLMTRIAKASIVGRLARAVRIPFTRAAGVQVLGVASGFVGEGQSIPVVRSPPSCIGLS
jgi:hypothetical protein